ncbi:PAS domain-containing protein [Sandaracinobacteroides saxicola]|uniref:histidine kinase n=2 Tax=Sandaracinobacteroides saxicola TaxID=2759707 RepID=A0A7G5IMG4_9SPHN|nr:PAS domain-containing protein [Sandaracinobacteroides saxicola]
MNLALAMVTASSVPLLLLDGELCVVAASESFCRGFGIDPARVVAQSMFALGQGEWDTPQLHALLEATAAGGAEVAAYEMRLRAEGDDPRALVLHARRLEHGNPDEPRLLLTIVDITEEKRAASRQEELIREKAVLMQEIQHRVANSLQIIASVLMQSARRVQSDESRGHLTDAHHRLMSVATLQRQLSSSSADVVTLRVYFAQLCNSIGASMIHDRDKLTLTVKCDDTIVGSDESVGLGLIVTELVINALKHGFPDGAGGAIVVSYRAEGEQWRLRVTDSGLGMPPAGVPTPAGLGSTIVEALAKRLGARIEISARQPGTRVSIIRDGAIADRAVFARAL